MIRGHVVGRYWATKRLDHIPSGAFLEVETSGGGRIMAFGCSGLRRRRGDDRHRLDARVLARRRQDPRSTR